MIDTGKKEGYNRRRRRRRGRRGRRRRRRRKAPPLWEKRRQRCDLSPLSLSLSFVPHAIYSSSCFGDSLILPAPETRAMQQAATSAAQPKAARMMLKRGGGER
jgi:hypothetical protein